MSGRKIVRISRMAIFKKKLQEKLDNWKNKSSADDLLILLETAIRQGRSQKSEHTIEEKLKILEKLHRRLSDHEHEKQFTSIIACEKEVVAACNSLRTSIIATTEKESKWRSPKEKLINLEHEFSDTSSKQPERLPSKWFRKEWDEMKSLFNDLRSWASNKSGNTEDLMTAIGELESNLTTLKEKADQHEKDSMDRDLLIETVRSALTSKEMRFDVRVRSLQEGNALSDKILEAWRPGNEMITMTFKLGKQSDDLETTSTGFSGTANPEGCTNTFRILEKQLSTVLEAVTFIKNDSSNPDEDQQAVPGNVIQDHLNTQNEKP